LGWVLELLNLSYKPNWLGWNFKSLLEEANLKKEVDSGHAKACEKLSEDLLYVGSALKYSVESSES